MINISFPLCRSVLLYCGVECGGASGEAVPGVGDHPGISAASAGQGGGQGGARGRGEAIMMSPVYI